MARPKGFEPLTPRFVVWCSIQLSYGRLPKGREPIQPGAGWQAQKCRNGRLRCRIGVPAAPAGAILSPNRASPEAIREICPQAGCDLPLSQSRPVVKTCRGPKQLLG